VALLEQGLKDRPAIPPKLSIVRSEPDTPEPPTLDATTWLESLNEVKYLAQSHRLTYMVNRATAKVGKLKLLGDAELLSLLAEMRDAAERLKRQPAVEESLVDDLSRTILWR
jgi:hypothetical protein